MAMAYRLQTLLNAVPVTKPSNENKGDAGAELVAIAKGSFDKLSLEIPKMQNAVVTCESTLNRFETEAAEQIEKFNAAINKERAEILSELESYKEQLASMRVRWDEMVHARGIRGVVPAAVERTAPTCKLSE